MIPRYLQLHYLHDYSGVLLNRDENGAAKRMTVGGNVRTRRSSQSTKRTIRKAEGPYALTNISPDPVRTRLVADSAVMSYINRHMPEADGEAVEAAIIAMNIGLYGKEGDDIKKRQNLLFGQSEVEWLGRSAVECLRENTESTAVSKAVAGLFSGADAKRNFSAFRTSQAMVAHLIGALMGRMVTADNRARIEGALHVNHSYTIHAEQDEFDFFTSIDDIRAELDNQGSASLFTTEINSGIFYLYMVVDIALLVSNTTGCSIDDWLNADRDIAAKASANVAALAATCLTGAKLGSTAAHSHAQVLLAEMGEYSPRSLGGAFTVPAQPTISDGLQRLTQHLAEMDQIYGVHEDRLLIAPGHGTSLEHMHAWIESSILKGDAEWPDRSS